MSEFRGNRSHGFEYPPYSRLFIVSNKSSTEEDFRSGFSEFGPIEDLYMVKDRKSGEFKGVTYIQYAKTSQAAKALETMNKKRLVNSSTPIKVLLASDKSSDSQDRDVDEILKAKRLFVMIPKSMNEKDLEEEFGKFGDVDDVSILRNKDTMDSKGLGFVRYKTFYDTACAFENADKKYKAVFAEPKKVVKNPSIGGHNNMNVGFNDSYSNFNVPNPEGYTRLNVTFNPYLHQGLLHNLFDIIPGLEFCNIKIDHQRRIGSALVGYSSPSNAAYAREKLDRFEYPPGRPLMVTPDLSSGLRQPDSNPRYRNSINPTYSRSNDFNTLNDTLKSAITDGNIDFVKLTETIAQATTLLQAAASGNAGLTSVESFCSVPLPPSKPFADVDAIVAKRLFIVCKPKPPPIQYIKDAFRRFGDLIDVYIMPRRTVGYVKYASVESANEAIRTLHGAELCEVRLKVMEAEEQPTWGKRQDSQNDNESDEGRKRIKLDE